MKKFLLVFIFLLSQCGYQSIYLNKNLNNLEFYKITHEGDAEINRKILGSLSFKENKLKETLNSYAENDEPHPQVVVAFGFLITNCDP